MQPALLEAALKLPDDERRELAERLIESLPLGDDDFALSPEQEAELERRERLLEEHGPRGRPWREVMADIREKLDL